VGATLCAHSGDREETVPHAKTRRGVPHLQPSQCIPVRVETPGPMPRGPGRTAPTRPSRTGLPASWRLGAFAFPMWCCPVPGRGSRRLPSFPPSPGLTQGRKGAENSPRGGIEASLHGSGSAGLGSGKAPGRENGLSPPIPGREPRGLTRTTATTLSSRSWLRSSEQQAPSSSPSCLQRPNALHKGPKRFRGSSSSSSCASCLSMFSFRMSIPVAGTRMTEQHATLMDRMGCSGIGTGDHPGEPGRRTEAIVLGPTSYVLCSMSSVRSPPSDDLPG